MKHVCYLGFFSKRIQVNQFLKPFSSVATPAPDPYPNKSSSPTPVSTALQRSDEWFALSRNRLTTSAFSTVLGFFKTSPRTGLWHHKVFESTADTSRLSTWPARLQWGLLNESAAVDRYKKITNNDVSFTGFVVHPDEEMSWLGGSPDGLLDHSPNGGILEVKCPYNKGKPEVFMPWSALPYYHMPQLQGQMEVMDRDWVDLYCWTPNGSTLFRVCRDRDYWKLIEGVLREFWWENVVPAREAVLLGDEAKAYLFKPGSVHDQTWKFIASSLKVAAGSKMLCRETAGNVEFYT